MSLPSPQSPTLAPPRITAARFKQLLMSKNSPAVRESDAIYAFLVAQKVDPSFALAQFRVESQYATEGYAAISGSWGNMLYDSALTTHNVGTYSPGNGYTYAAYATFLSAVIDYCVYIHEYIDVYGLKTIYGTTARWIGKVPGSPGHLNYVNTIITDMIYYEYPSGTPIETGDKMIYAGPAFDRSTGKVTQKYPVTAGMALYRGTNGDFLKSYTGTPGNAWWLGFVNGSTEWGALFIGTSLADSDATLVYIKNPVKSKIINV